jgi:hypothetical protein
VAIVLLVVNFDFVEDDLWGVVPVFNGFYPDFTVQWYQAVGKQICFTLLLFIVSPHGTYISKALLNLGLRYWDRGFS